jgi:hypothetical protein
MHSAFKGKSISSIPTSLWYMDTVYLAFHVSWHRKLPACAMISSISKSTLLESTITYLEKKTFLRVLIAQPTCDDVKTMNTNNFWSVQCFMFDYDVTSRPFDYRSIM